jgi:hypothetical protein
MPIGETDSQAQNCLFLSFIANYVASLLLRCYCGVMEENKKTTLLRYIYSNHDTLASFAKIAGINPSYLSHCLRDRPIGKRTAMKIEKATHGEVTFAELLKGDA